MSIHVHQTAEPAPAAPTRCGLPAAAVTNPAADGLAGQSDVQDAHALAKATETAGICSTPPRQPSATAARSFELECRFCLKPMRFGPERYLELCKADERPLCRECRRYLPYLEE